MYVIPCDSFRQSPLPIHLTENIMQNNAEERIGVCHLNKNWEIFSNYAAFWQMNSNISNVEILCYFRTYSNDM